MKATFSLSVSLSTLVLFLISQEKSETDVLLIACPRPHSYYVIELRYHFACLNLFMTLIENSLEGIRDKRMIVFINSGYVAINIS